MVIILTIVDLFIWVKTWNIFFEKKYLKGVQIESEKVTGWFNFLDESVEIQPGPSENRLRVSLIDSLNLQIQVKLVIQI